MTPPSDKPFILGIDPGYRGALALYSLDTSSLVEVIDMPSKLSTTASGGQKRRLIMPEIANFLDINKDMIRGCVIEEVTAMPGNGVTGMFNFGFSTGQIHGMLAAFNIDVIAIRPTTWKSVYGLTKDKKLSIERAKIHFPTHVHSFRKSSHDGRAEAAFLAKYGERIFQNQKGHLV